MCPFLYWLILMRRFYYPTLIVDKEKKFSHFTYLIFVHWQCRKLSIEVKEWNKLQIQPFDPVFWPHIVITSLSHHNIVTEWHDVAGGELDDELVSVTVRHHPVTSVDTGYTGLSSPHHPDTRPYHNCEHTADHLSDCRHCLFTLTLCLNFLWHR